MIQNLNNETGWHLRGTRRVGVSKEDVEVVQQCVSRNPILPFILDKIRACFVCSIQRRADLSSPIQIELVADFAEVPLNRVPRVDDIEHEV